MHRNQEHQTWFSNFPCQVNEWFIVLYTLITQCKLQSKRKSNRKDYCVGQDYLSLSLTKSPYRNSPKGLAMTVNFQLFLFRHYLSQYSILYLPALSITYPSTLLIHRTGNFPWHPPLQFCTSYTPFTKSTLFSLITCLNNITMPYFTHSTLHSPNILLLL